MPDPKDDEQDPCDEALRLLRKRSTEARTQRIVRKRLKLGAARALQDLDVEIRNRGSHTPGQAP